MTGGISSGFPALIPAGYRTGTQVPLLDSSTDRPRPTDGFRDPARPGQDRSQVNAYVPSPSSGFKDGDGISQRQVEARATAQAARLESDRGPALPRALQQALDMYRTVAGSREGLDVELVGLDLKV